MKTIFITIHKWHFLCDRIFTFSNSGLFFFIFRMRRAREGLIVKGECRLRGIRRVNKLKVCQHVRNCSIPPITVDPTNYPSSGQVPLQNLI